jgi:hypothetical protein
MILFWLLIGSVAVILLGTLGETLLWSYFWQQQVDNCPGKESNWKHAIVFLTGISDYASVSLQPEQISFLQEVSEFYRADIILAEPFPYEMLTAQKFSRFDIWRCLGFSEPPLWVMSLHNFWQTILIVLFPKKWGSAVARCIDNRLGISPENGRTLLFICGSSGAAIALAAAPFLPESLQANLIILSYGGVFNSSPNFGSVDKFYHLIGERDYWVKLGEIFFLNRWLSMESLAKARIENRFSIHSTGCHKHFGAEGYLSDRAPKNQDKTYRQLTLNVIYDLYKKGQSHR